MMRWTPYVTVATVVERAGRFLLVEEDRGGPHTLFNQPAGHLEPGERIRDGALREVAEETAWRVGITDYLGMYVYEAPDGKTFHSHAFFGMALAHLGTELDRDIMAIHWLTLEDVEALEREGRLRSPLVIKRIRDALAGKTFPMEVLHER
ncbi:MULTISPECIES: NUDIX hydrolase [Halomonas]|uniref:NUDIX hydrolase n=3 Tax=Halomonas TaxID=2745 RepID=A0AAU7KNE1_9GAMM|nr:MULTISPECIES: NUDIX hydrolase [Halomonas]MBR9773053.1 NUDIX hydrolase [Gammaproteobacteria bacterium]MCO7214190.1 NUDIX hydrolase [Halomonas sp. OfavH-34-E]KJZ14131.1 NUDIX hydrolase [Halomonas sp. S2151]MAR73228.1 NUDIX hydrolase [Halomonas sp.]MBR9880579.1 NUDIX hydrolase [Gammaproteobacteria bacterium]